MRLAHTTAHPELAWMGPSVSKSHSRVEGYKSKAPHTASVRDAVGLSLLPVSMPAQGRLLGLVGQTRGSHVPTPTTDYMTHMTQRHVYIVASLRGMLHKGGEKCEVALLGKTTVGC